MARWAEQNWEAWKARMARRLGTESAHPPMKTPAAAAVCQTTTHSQDYTARVVDTSMERGGGDGGSLPLAAVGKPADRAPPIYPLVRLCRAVGLPEPMPEYRFHPVRKWRFDYAWPLDKLALEVEGGLFTAGRHTRGAGALADLEKYSEAAILGWRVIYCTPKDLATLGLDRVQRGLEV